jgi:hypothetical protein
MRNLQGASFIEDGVSLNKPNSTELLVQFYMYFIMI